MKALVRYWCANATAVRGTRLSLVLTHSGLGSAACVQGFEAGVVALSRCQAPSLRTLRVATVAGERIEDCRDDLFGFGVDGDNRTSLQHLSEFERLADRRDDDQRPARVTSSEPAHDLTAVFLFEVERSDNEVGSFDGYAGLEPVEGAARRWISRRVGAPADPNCAARAADRSCELQTGIRVREFDQHARPLRVRPRLQVDRDGALPHRPRTVTAAEQAHIRVPPNLRYVRSTDLRRPETNGCRA